MSGQARSIGVDSTLTIDCMSTEDQDKLAGQLMVERSKLSKEIAAIRADLAKRSAGFREMGARLAANPETIKLERGEILIDDERRLFFPLDALDIPKIGELTDELRTQSRRLEEINQSLRAMGH